MAISINRARLAGWAGAIVLSIFIPVAIDQAYFRYNAWLLPSLGLAAGVLYLVMALTSRPAVAFFRRLRAGFGTRHSFAFGIACIFGIVMLIVGLGLSWHHFLRLSQQHVTDLRNKDSAPLMVSPIPFTKRRDLSNANPQAEDGHESSKAVSSRSAHTNRSAIVPPGLVTLQPGAVASFNQQGGQTAGIINNNVFTGPRELVLTEQQTAAAQVRLREHPASVRLVLPSPAPNMASAQTTRGGSQVYALFEGWQRDVIILGSGPIPAGITVVGNSVDTQDVINAFRAAEIPYSVNPDGYTGPLGAGPAPPVTVTVSRTF